MQSATRTKLILYLGSLKPERNCKFHQKPIFPYWRCWYGGVCPKTKYNAFPSNSVVLRLYTTHKQHSRKARVKTKVSSVSQTSQVPSKKRHKPDRKKIRNTTDDKDLRVLKERVQSNVKGKDLSLWFMWHED